MYAAQQIICLKSIYARMARLNITTLFVYFTKFEDDFNYFFNDFNTVVQFLFYTTTNTINQEQLLEILNAHQRGVDFSILCYDDNLSFTTLKFIEALIKMNKYDFLYNQLAKCLASYFGYKIEFIKRLITIIVKKTRQHIPNDNEKIILKSTRIASLENIIYMEFDDEWTLPLSEK